MSHHEEQDLGVTDLATVHYKLIDPAISDMFETFPNF